MKISLKLQKNIETELKKQKYLLSLMENQEKEYGVIFDKVSINESIAYYEKILKEVR